MTVRLGINKLIQQVRKIGHITTTDMEIDGVTYWTDQQIQDELDNFSKLFSQVKLQNLPEISALGVTEYRTFKIPYELGYIKYVEGTESGDIRFRIMDDTPALVSSGLYTLNQLDGTISFTIPYTEMSNLYVTGYSYDLYMTAINILNHRAANFSLFYNFSMDGQRIDRQQAYVNVMKFIEKLSVYIGTNMGKNGDITMSMFVRTDLL